MIERYENALAQRFPLGRVVSDVDADYGFRPALAVDLKTADGVVMRNAVKICRTAAPSPDEVADRMWGWLEGRLTRRVRAASDGK